MVLYPFLGYLRGHGQHHGLNTYKSLFETRKTHCFGGFGVHIGRVTGVAAVGPLRARGSPSSDYTPLELKLILNSTRRKALSVTWPLHGNGKSPDVKANPSMPIHSHTRVYCEKLYASFPADVGRSVGKCVLCLGKPRT